MLRRSCSRCRHRNHPDRTAHTTASGSKGVRTISDPPNATRSSQRFLSGWPDNRITQGRGGRPERTDTVLCQSQSISSDCHRTIGKGFAFWLVSAHEKDSAIVRVQSAARNIAWSVSRSGPGRIIASARGLSSRALALRFVRVFADPQSPSIIIPKPSSEVHLA